MPDSKKQPISLVATKNISESFLNLQTVCESVGSILSISTGSLAGLGFAANAMSQMQPFLVGIQNALSGIVLPACLGLFGAAVGFYGTSVFLESGKDRKQLTAEYKRSKRSRSIGTVADWVKIASHKKQAVKAAMKSLSLHITAGLLSAVTAFFVVASIFIPQFIACAVAVQAVNHALNIASGAAWVAAYSRDAKQRKSSQYYAVSTALGVSSAVIAFASLFTPIGPAVLGAIMIGIGVVSSGIFLRGLLFEVKERKAAKVLAEEAALAEPKTNHDKVIDKAEDKLSINDRMLLESNNPANKDSFSLKKLFKIAKKSMQAVNDESKQQRDLSKHDTVLSQFVFFRARNKLKATQVHSEKQVEINVIKPKEHKN